MNIIGKVNETEMCVYVDGFRLPRSERRLFFISPFRFLCASCLVISPAYLWFLLLVHLFAFFPICFSAPLAAASLRLQRPSIFLFYFFFLLSFPFVFAALRCPLPSSPPSFSSLFYFICLCFLSYLFSLPLAAASSSLPLPLFSSSATLTLRLSLLIKL